MTEEAFTIDRFVFTSFRSSPGGCHFFRCHKSLFLFRFIWCFRYTLSLSLSPTMTSLSVPPHGHASLRHALQSSLKEILNDGCGNDDLRNVAGFPHSKPSVSLPPDSSAATRVVSPQAMYPPTSSSLNSNSVLAQSLGLSSFPGSIHHLMGQQHLRFKDNYASCSNDNGSSDLLMSVAAAAAAEARLIAHGRALLLQRQLAQEEDKNRMIRETYLAAALRNQAIIGNKAAVPYLPSTAVSASGCGIVEHHPMAAATMSEQRKVSHTLHALGSNLRNRSDPYIDCSTYVDPVAESTPASARTRGGKFCRSRQDRFQRAYTDAPMDLISNDPPLPFPRSFSLK